MRLIDVTILTTLILIEILASTLIKNAAENKNNKNNLLAGVVLYALVGYIFYEFLKSFKGSFSLANTLWQILNIILITIISLIFFKEKINKIQWVGFTLIIAGLILLDMFEHV